MLIESETVKRHKQRLAIPVTWKAGDTVRVEGRQARVRYVYTNGFTLVEFEGMPIEGGIFNNNSTFSNEAIGEADRVTVEGKP